MSIQQLRNVALALCVFAGAALAADSPFLGTWKMNAEKSRVTGADALQNVTVKYEMDGDRLKASVDATDMKGQSVSFSYEAAMDGKPGTTTGSTTFDTIMIHRISAYSMRATGKKGDKIVYTDRRTVSNDGKTFTILRTGTDQEGKPYRSTLVFHKQ